MNVLVESKCNIEQRTANMDIAASVAGRCNLRL